MTEKSDDIITFTVEDSTDPSKNIEKNKLDKPKKQQSPPIHFTYIESGSESEDEIGDETESEKEARQMAQLSLAMGDCKASIERQIKKVGDCDGSDPEKTLRWLRALDNASNPLNVAKVTATRPLAAYVNNAKSKTWFPLRKKIAENFVHAGFQQNQRDALEKLTQRSGENLTKFTHEFHILLREAYDTLPADQTALIRTYLSALGDRQLAITILEQDKPATLQEAVSAVRKKSKAGEVLKPQSKGGKAHELTPFPESVALTHAVESLVKCTADISRAQKEMEGEILELKKTKNPPKLAKEQVGNCYRCGKPGHFARECRSNLTKPPPQQAPSTAAANEPPKGYCVRCRKTSHEVKNCRAGPPPRPCYCGGSHWIYDCPERQRSNYANQGN